MILRSLCLSALLFTIACTGSTPPPEPEPPAPADPPAEPTTPGTPAAANGLHAGLLKQAGPEAPIQIAACGTRDFRVVSGSPAALREVGELLRKHALVMNPEATEYEATLLFLGRMSDAEAHIESWQRIGEGRCEASEPASDWQFHGTEPFWSLKLSADGARFNLMDPESEKAFGAPEMSEESERILAMLKDEAGDRTRVEIVRKPCSDGMADITYAYTVAVAGLDGSYSGCGVRLRP